MYDLYGLTHVPGWEPYNLHDLFSACFLGPICTTQILHNISYRQFKSQDDLDYLSADDLSVHDLSVHDLSDV